MQDSIIHFSDSIVSHSLAYLSEAHALSLHVVSDPHKVKVRGNKDGGLSHEVPRVCWENLRQCGRGINELLGSGVGLYLLNKVREACIS